MTEPKPNAQAGASFAPCGCYAADVTIIESEGIVTGGSVSEQLVEVKIPMRPSGLKIGDKCWLTWQRHDLRHNGPSSATADNDQPK